MSGTVVTFNTFQISLDADKEFGGWMTGKIYYNWPTSPYSYRGIWEFNPDNTMGGNWAQPGYYKPINQSYTHTRIARNSDGRWALTNNVNGQPYAIVNGINDDSFPLQSGWPHGSRATHSCTINRIRSITQLGSETKLYPVWNKKKKNCNHRFI